MCRMDAALDHMRPLGFSNQDIRAAVKDLLKVYGDDGWVFLEEGAYKILLDTLLERAEGDENEIQNENENGEVAEDHINLVLRDGEVQGEPQDENSSLLNEDAPQVPVEPSSFDSFALNTIVPVNQETRGKKRAPCYGLIDVDDDCSSVDNVMKTIRYLAKITTIIMDRRSATRERGQTVLDELLDAMFEKRVPKRENVLASLIQEFNNNADMQQLDKFVEKNFATILYHRVNSFKKGASKEVSLAARFLGLVALTTIPGWHIAREIRQESISPISEALRSDSFGLSTYSSLVDCLAMVTFIGGVEKPEETEEAIKMLCYLINADDIYDTLLQS
ncbi:hypothetical protein LIER_38390 [Lithospermum erythrorhizon]|uniref:WIYLD domain-containing protein n=1 Tax=Lithospermum erythrorhizon TaxID=34254 RepID=A0AAV3Q182_LITER